MGIQFLFGTRELAAQVHQGTLAATLLVVHIRIEVEQTAVDTLCLIVGGMRRRGIAPHLREPQFRHIDGTPKHRQRSVLAVVHLIHRKNGAIRLLHLPCTPQIENLLHRHSLPLLEFFQRRLDTVHSLGDILFGCSVRKADTAVFAERRPRHTRHMGFVEQVLHHIVGTRNHILTVR